MKDTLYSGQGRFGRHPRHIDTSANTNKGNTYHSTGQQGTKKFPALVVTANRKTVGSQHSQKKHTSPVLRVIWRPGRNPGDFPRVHGELAWPSE